jgi:thiamine biosynthesis lipoprotein
MTPAASLEPRLATASWEALGTTAIVRVDDRRVLDQARSIVAAELDRIDLAASRFRADSELEHVNANVGRLVPVSRLLHDAIASGIRAAELTSGAVDPTLGAEIRRAGYVDDWHTLQHPPLDDRDAPARVQPRPEKQIPAWQRIELSSDPTGVRLPPGASLDLGATAKALSADRAADAVALATGAGVLVALGGDIAIAGRVLAGGWLIHVTDDHRSEPSAAGQTVSLRTGALATSSTTTRRWIHDGAVMHHILDPSTGAPAAGPWRTASVTAATCVDANLASTAAIVFGEDGPEWLSNRRLAARLVAYDGSVLTLGGWPEDGR